MISLLHEGSQSQNPAIQEGAVADLLAVPAELVLEAWRVLQKLFVGNHWALPATCCSQIAWSCPLFVARKRSIADIGSHVQCRLGPLLIYLISSCS